MGYHIIPIQEKKRIALVAHDNRASADFMISSTLMTGEYERLVVDYKPYRERQVEALVADKMDELGHGSTPASTSDNDTTSSAAGV